MKSLKAMLREAKTRAQASSEPQTPLSPQTPLPSQSTVQNPAQAQVQTQALGSQLASANSSLPLSPAGSGTAAPILSAPVLPQPQSPSPSQLALARSLSLAPEALFRLSLAEAVALVAATDAQHIAIAATAAGADAGQGAPCAETAGCSEDLGDHSRCECDCACRSAGAQGVHAAGAEADVTVGDNSTGNSETETADNIDADVNANDDDDDDDDDYAGPFDPARVRHHYYTYPVSTTATATATASATPETATIETETATAAALATAAPATVCCQYSQRAVTALEERALLALSAAAPPGRWTTLSARSLQVWGGTVAAAGLLRPEPDLQSGPEPDLQSNLQSDPQSDPQSGPEPGSGASAGDRGLPRWLDDLCRTRLPALSVAFPPTLHEAVEARTKAEADAKAAQAQAQADAKAVDASAERERLQTLHCAVAAATEARAFGLLPAPNKSAHDSNEPDNSNNNSNSNGDSDADASASTSAEASAAESDTDASGTGMGSGRSSRRTGGVALRPGALVSALRPLPAPRPTFANHVLLNRYARGQGILPHCDGPAYAPQAAILSLGAPVVLAFWRSAAEARAGGAAAAVMSLVLEPRSLCVFSGALYWDTLHGIAPARCDRVWPHCANAAVVAVPVPRGAQDDRSLIVGRRGRRGLVVGQCVRRGAERLSLTLRRVAPVWDASAAVELRVPGEPRARTREQKTENAQSEDKDDERKRAAGRDD